MGKKQDESLKYMEGNYSNLWELPGEFLEDVQQASEMMDAEEYWKGYMESEKAAREEHHYLVEGAVLTCTACTLKPVRPFKEEFTAPEGSDERLLKITKERGFVNGSGQRFATVKDRIKWENIEPFGNCKNPPNRQKEIEAVKMAETSEELRKLGTCRYSIDLRSDWENLLGEGGYDSCPFCVDMEEGITMEAILFCSQGGFIYPKTSGYMLTEEEIPYGTKLPEEEIKSLLEDYFEIMGWKKQDCEYLAKVMKDADMDTRLSIEFFLLTCDHESGKGTILKQVGGEGRGYIQIDDTSLGGKKTEFWTNLYIYTNQWRIGNGKTEINLPMAGDKLTAAGIDQLKKLSEKEDGVGWEASIYYWSQHNVVDNYKTPLDDYVASYECGTGGDHTEEGLYYAVQCFVNGAETGNYTTDMRKGNIQDYVIIIDKTTNQNARYQLERKNSQENPVKAPVGSVGRARLYHEYYGGNKYIWNFSKEIIRQWDTISS